MEVMIKEAFISDKDFILAKIYLKDRNQAEHAENQKIICKYYNAFSVIKHVIQVRRDGEHIGRFHEEWRMQHSIPNLESYSIVDEIEFYLIKQNTDSIFTSDQKKENVVYKA